MAQSLRDARAAAALNSAFNLHIRPHVPASSPLIGLNHHRHRRRSSRAAAEQQQSKQQGRLINN